MYCVMSVFGRGLHIGPADDFGVAGRHQRRAERLDLNDRVKLSVQQRIVHLRERHSGKRTLVRSTPCFSSSATACSQAVLLMTLTATRLPSRSLSDFITPFFTITAVVVSGGDVRTIAPGASTMASSPCSMAWNVETVLLSTMSNRPDCSTGTAIAAAIEFRDFDLKTFFLEEALLVGDHGRERFWRTAAGPT